MLLDKIITPCIRDCTLLWKENLVCDVFSALFGVAVILQGSGFTVEPEKNVHLVAVELNQLFWCTTYWSAFVYLQCWRWCLSPWINAIWICSSFPWHYVRRSYVAGWILLYSVKHCRSFHCCGAAVEKKLACPGETAEPRDFTYWWHNPTRIHQLYHFQTWHFTLLFKKNQIHDFKLIWWVIWKKLE